MGDSKDKVERALLAFESLKAQVPTASTEVPQRKPTPASARRPTPEEASSADARKSADALLRQLHTTNQQLERRVRELEATQKAAEKQHALDARVRQQEHERALRQLQKQHQREVARLTQEKQDLAQRLAAKEAAPAPPPVPAPPAPAASRHSQYIAVLQDNIATLELRLRQAGTQQEQLLQARVDPLAAEAARQGQTQKLWGTLHDIIKQNNLVHEAERVRMNELLYLLEREVSLH